MVTSAVYLSQPRQRRRRMRMPMRPMLVVAVLVRLLTGLTLAVADEADDVPRTLVYFASGGPLIVAVDISLNGKSLSSFRNGFIERQFKQYDKDSDGSLKPEEAAQVPTLGRIMAGSAVLGDQWTELDRDPKDERVSLKEFAAHYDAAMGPAFTLQKQVKERFQEVDLTGKLDTNGDHALSADEVRTGLAQLNRLDLDDDETISAAELAPLYDPSMRNGGAPNAPQNTLEAWPFLMISGEGKGSADEAAQNIIRHYDGQRGGAADSRLSRDEIPDAFDRMKSADRDRNGSLSATELATLLNAPRNPLLISVRMPERGSPTIAHPDLPDRTIEFKARKWTSDVSDTVSLYRIRFLQNDRDKNQYLNQQEFGGLQLSDASFGMCDLNSDSMLTVEELTSFVDQRATLSRCRVIMRVESDQRSLFEILDTNMDRRLSNSEFLAGPERLREFDPDGDRLFRQGDLTTKFRVVVEVARTELFQNLAMRQPNAEAASPRLQTDVRGPVWFQRMDLNRDGDVSRREFLGPLEDFDRLDANHDGLLSSPEAEAAPAS